MEIVAKPGKRKTEITKIENDIIYMNVKGKAENNEANDEIIRFFSKNREYNPKLLHVKIVKGFKKRRKIIVFK